MISFESDYTEGAHEAILQRLVETNREQTPGYGTDIYTLTAQEKIRQACGCPDAEVKFLIGGTQTNQFVIDMLCEPIEGVIAAQSGHVNVHEAGAIEHKGHKVLTVPQENGKLKAADVRKLIEDFYADSSFDHMVFPGAVYISHPTEYGTLYTLDELTELSNLCREKKIPLFLDGARLGYGLMSEDTDVTLKDIARLCDVFYIGGTKVGCLFGEAVVFTHDAPKYLTPRIKQHGALLAKGRILGLQFDTLFTDDLYLKISKSAIDKAMRIKRELGAKGYKFFIDSPTNQQFVILDNKKLEEISDRVACSIWEPYDESHTVVRFATSWATTDEQVSKLMEIM